MRGPILTSPPIQGVGGGSIAHTPSILVRNTPTFGGARPIPGGRIVVSRTNTFAHRNAMFIAVLFGVFIGFACMSLMVALIGALEYGYVFEQQRGLLADVYRDFFGQVFGRLLPFSPVILLSFTLPIAVQVKLLSLGKTNIRQLTRAGSSLQQGRALPYLAAALKAFFRGLIVGIICSYVIDGILDYNSIGRVYGDSIWPPVLCIGLPLAIIIYGSITKQAVSPMSQFEAKESILDSLTLLFCAGFAFFAAVSAQYAELSSLNQYNRMGITITWSLMNALFVGCISKSSFFARKARPLIAILLSLITMYMLSWVMDIYV
jgi:hypothetical protein